MRTLALIACFLLLSGCMVAQAAIPKADASVDSLTLTGASRLSAAEQKEIVDYVEKRDYPREDLAQEVRQRVLYALQTRGYFKAKVGDPQIRILSQNKRQEIVAATVAITEGEQYRLKDITFQNPKAIPADELRRQFTLQNGDIFDTEKIRQGLEAIRRLYASKGYPNFSAVPQVNLDDASRTVALNITIDQGAAATR